MHANHEYIDNTENLLATAKVKSVLTTFRLEVSCRAKLEEIAGMWNTNLTRAVQRVIEEAYADLKQSVNTDPSKHDYSLIVDAIRHELTTINTKLDLTNQLNDMHFAKLSAPINASAVRLLALTRHNDKSTQIEHEIQKINTGQD
jgi:neutral trehalase